MEAVISFLSEYRLTGLTVGIFTFLIIGLFHPLVIKAEYSKRFLKSQYNDEPSISLGVTYTGDFL